MAASPLIARVRFAAPPPGPAPDDATTLPLPVPGFRRVETGFIELSRDGQTLGAIELARVERRLAGRLLASGVLVGPLPAFETEDPADGYRAVLDALVPTATGPHVASFAVRDETSRNVDCLWRLALALDARCIVSEEAGSIRVDLVFSGRRARLAMALADRPRLSLPWLLRALGAVGMPRDKRLLIFARDVRVNVAEVRPLVDVQFGEATEGEIRSRPRRFGLPLSANPSHPDPSRRFVGRIRDRVVYWMSCAPSAPALSLLPAECGARLVGPLALVTNASTDPQFRGSSIYPAGLQWLAVWAADNGVRTLVLLVRSENVASIRGAIKAGFAQVGEMAQPR